MKKALFFLLFTSTIVVFEFCSTSKKAQNTASGVTYTSDVQNVISANCSPCHVGNNARQKRLDSYDAAKAHINDVVRRVQLNPGDKGFMPFKHQKLSDSTIQVLVRWREEGSPQ